MVVECSANEQLLTWWRCLFRLPLGGIHDFARKQGCSKQVRRAYYNGCSRCSNRREKTKNDYTNKDIRNKVERGLCWRQGGTVFYHRVVDRHANKEDFMTLVHILMNLRARVGGSVYGVGGMAWESRNDRNIHGQMRQPEAKELNVAKPHKTLPHY